MRVTATKEKSEAIVQAIEATLQGARSLTIDLNALVSGPKRPEAGAKNHVEAAYTESLINELAQLTETHITRLPNNHVSCMKCKQDISSTDRD